MTGSSMTSHPNRRSSLVWVTQLARKIGRFRIGMSLVASQCVRCFSGDTPTPFVSPFSSLNRGINTMRASTNSNGDRKITHLEGVVIHIAL